jgi:hypothetical protein
LSPRTLGFFGCGFAGVGAIIFAIVAVSSTTLYLHFKQTDGYAGTFVVVDPWFAGVFFGLSVVVLLGSFILLSRASQYPWALGRSSHGQQLH